MKTLDLTKKETLFDYLMRYIAEQAKEMTGEKWMCWFIDMIIFRNNQLLPKILECVRHKNDMTKMYFEFKNASL